MMFVKRIFVIFLVIFQLLGYPNFVLASVLSSDTIDGIVLAQTSWQPPEKEVREGFWGRLRGLGRRGPCSDLDPPLIALVPALPSLSDSAVLSSAESVQFLSNNAGTTNFVFAEQGIALTLSSHPNFWLYIPSQARDAEWLEFMLQDDNGEDILDKPIQARLETGLVSIQIPENLAKFDLNQPYHWYASLICDTDRPARNPHVDGWTERVDPIALGINTTEIDQLSPQERLNRYSQFNIWHETIELLAEEQCSSSQDASFAEYWNILLEDILPDVSRNWINPSSYCIHPEPLEIILEAA